MHVGLYHFVTLSCCLPVCVYLAQTNAYVVSLFLKEACFVTFRTAMGLQAKGSVLVSGGLFLETSSLANTLVFGMVRL